MRKIDDKTIEELNDIDCLIIDNYDNNIESNIFYSILNQSKQLDNYLLINSEKSIKSTFFKLEDLNQELIVLYL